MLLLKEKVLEFALRTKNSIKVWTWLKCTRSRTKVRDRQHWSNNIRSIFFQITFCVTEIFHKEIWFCSILICFIFLSLICVPFPVRHINLSLPCHNYTKLTLSKVVVDWKYSLNIEWSLMNKIVHIQKYVETGFSNSLAPPKTTHDFHLQKYILSVNGQKYIGIYDL